MSDLSPKELNQFQKVEELLDFKRHLEEEKKLVAEAVNARINAIRETAEKHGISLEDLDLRITGLQQDFDQLAQRAESCFQQACLDAKAA